MISTIGPEEETLDEHKPSWITVGRPHVQGICEDLIAAVANVIRDLSLIAVVLRGEESQPETIVGKLRGELISANPWPDSEGLEAALSGVGEDIPRSVMRSLAARLELAALAMIPLDTTETRAGVLIIGADDAEHRSFDDLTRLGDYCDQAALAISNLKLRRLLARSERYRRDADMLVAAASDLTSCRVATTLHSKIVSYAKDLAGAQLAFLALFAEDQDDLVVTTTCGERSKSLIGMRIPLSEGIAAMAIQDRAVAMTSDLMTDPRRRPAWERVRLAEGIHGSIWVPLFAGKRLLGLLQVANRHVTQFTEEEARILQQLAEIAVVAMNNVNVYEQQQQAITDLQNQNQAAIASWRESERQASTLIDMTAALWSNDGFDGISTALAEFLSRPVILCNHSRYVLVCKTSADARAHGIGEALVATLAKPESDLSVALTRIPHNSRLQRLVVSNLEDANVPCIAAPIAAKETLVGFLIVPEIGHSLNESDLFVIEHAVRLCATEFLRTREVGRAQEKLGSDLLHDLLERGPDEHSVRQALAFRYLLEDNHRIAVFHIGSEDGLPSPGQTSEEPGGVHKLLTAIRAELEMPTYPTGMALSALHDGLVTVVIPDCLDAGQWAEMHSNLSGRFPNTPITASISQPFRGMENVLPTYQNCNWILRSAIQLGREGRVVESEELGIYGLLTQAKSRERLVEFARYTLGGLLGEDPKHRIDLLHTLDLYLKNSCRLEKTARALHIHPHTLRYRIDRIEEILGHPVDKPDWREEVHAAIAIARVEFPELFRSDIRS